MKIDFIVNDGSPQFVTEKTIWGDMLQPGVGGAELALLTMCAGLQQRGHDVTLYNDPREPGASSFLQRGVREFKPKDKRDALVIFRSPNMRSINANGYKIWWSCDQRTIGDFQGFSKTVNKIVTISQYHSDYFSQMYGINDTVITDLPVRDADYKDLMENPPERVPNRFIFSSVPDRGLTNLWRMWPRVKQLIPDATLVVTSDYRLWGGSANNEGHRLRWSARDGIYFLGAVNRKRLLEEQMKAEYCLYPGSYPELFCIAVAELQYAGVNCITSNIGALATTNMGTVVPVDASNAHNDKLFIDALMAVHDDPNRSLKRGALQQYAAQRFCLDTILDYWEANILKG
jgi:glycosyltransferase involved in cell wall biosynthesis